MSVEFTQEPVVAIDDDARIEVLVPMVDSSAAWRSAFERALPTRRGYYLAIRAERDGICFRVKNEKQLDEYLAVVDAAATQANRRLRAAHERVPKVSARLKTWFDNHGPLTID